MSFILINIFSGLLLRCFHRFGAKRVICCEVFGEKSMTVGDGEEVEPFI